MQETKRILVSHACHKGIEESLEKLIQTLISYIFDFALLLLLLPIFRLVQRQLMGPSPCCVTHLKQTKSPLPLLASPTVSLNIANNPHLVRLKSEG